MHDDIPADVNDVMDNLTARVARLTRENAILQAQISTLSKKLKEADHGQGAQPDTESPAD